MFYRYLGELLKMWLIWLTDSSGWVSEYVSLKHAKTLKSE